MRDFTLRSARFIAADCLRRFLLPGDRVIDATMGNGHDTKMLCELVGESGIVFAFDIQEQAVLHTKQKLMEAGLLSRARLFCCGHQYIERYVDEPVDAVVFNLGWLPGGDKSVTTQWETTKEAVEKALILLKPEGICSICVYPGHTEGENERAQLKILLEKLRPQEYNVLHHRFINAGPGAPECYLIQKQSI
ncbi:MAG: class I SAM-dependent methyltransferase [Clostridia bacterium]|nr:class I SAM-dependent methyltransferase [Clostridia bacterium]